MKHDKLHKQFTKFGPRKILLNWKIFIFQHVRQLCWHNRPADIYCIKCVSASLQHLLFTNYTQPHIFLICFLLISSRALKNVTDHSRKKDFYSFFPFGKSKIRWTTVTVLATPFDPKLRSSRRFTGKVLTTVALYVSATERHDRISCMILGWRALLKKCNGCWNEILFICRSYRHSSVYCCHRTLRLLLSPLPSSSMSSLLSKVNNSKQTTARDNNKPLPSAECINSLAGVRIFTLRHGCISNGPRLIWGKNSDLYIPFLSTVFTN